MNIIRMQKFSTLESFSVNLCDYQRFRGLPPPGANSSESAYTELWGKYSGHLSNRGSIQTAEFLEYVIALEKSYFGITLSL
jgi:hypothetical protein